MVNLPGHDYGGTRYEKDLRHFQDLMIGREMQRFAQYKAREAMGYARKISPPPYHSDKATRSSSPDRASKTGKHYKDQFRVEGPHIRNLTTRYPSLRASYDVVNTSPYALEVEIGWKRRVRFSYSNRRTESGSDGYHVLGLTRSFIGDPFEPENEL